MWASVPLDRATQAPKTRLTAPQKADTPRRLFRTAYVTSSAWQDGSCLTQLILPEGLMPSGFQRKRVRRFASHTFIFRLTARASLPVVATPTTGASGCVPPLDPCKTKASLVDVYSLTGYEKWKLHGFMRQSAREPEHHECQRARAPFLHAAVNPCSRKKTFPFSLLTHLITGGSFFQNHRKT